MGCASVPQIDQSVGPPSSTTPKPEIIGARGPLTAQQSKALLDRISTEPGDAGVLQRHLAIEEAVAESPLIAGNRTQLLRDGPASFRAMFSAIQGATNHINLEYFIFEDVESDGVNLGDLLVAKREAGVAVNLIYDSFGSSSTPDAFFDRLKKAGVNVVDYNPLSPFKSIAGWYSPNDRDHRKILIVDGATAIIGGVNLSTTYQSNPLGKSGAAEGKSMDMWRDTDLKIEGPAVAQLQMLFLDHWNKQKGPPIGDAKMFPVVPAKGTAVARIIGSTPDKSVPRYYVTLLSAIRNAEKTIKITAAYFVPTAQEMEDLTGAARRGVDVRLVLPDVSDSSLSIAVGHSHYTELLEAGVKIYETHDLVLHSKTVVIDGVWSMIGSSNFDHRSVIFNDEVDAVLLGSETASELEEMFDDDQQGATAIDLNAWKNRSVFEKMNEVFAVAWQNML
ncbi:MAG TPA: phospholipase D-like domain-containing protein [Micropepsaceae bacterium]|nr:phospholipase D-like domain-containing protein [Micropepsaceae bacterium]